MICYTCTNLDSLHLQIHAITIAKRLELLDEDKMTHFAIRNMSHLISIQLFQSLE